MPASGRAFSGRAKRPRVQPVASLTVRSAVATPHAEARNWRRLIPFLRAFSSVRSRESAWALGGIVRPAGIPSHLVAMR